MSIWGLLYHYFQSNPYLGCTISVNNKWAFIPQWKFYKRVWMILPDKICSFGISLNLIAVIHHDKGFSLNFEWPQLTWTEGCYRQCFNTDSCISGFDAECRESLNVCLLTLMNIKVQTCPWTLSIQLSKALDVSEVQAPLLPQHNMQNLDTKLA